MSRGATLLRLLQLLILVGATTAAHTEQGGGTRTSLLPKRRMRFVASTNNGASSFQPLADAFIEHNASYNVASAYCSDPGPFVVNSSLPDPP